MLKDIMEGKALLETVLTVEQDDNWMTQGRCAMHPDPDIWFDPIEDLSPRYEGMKKDVKAKARARDRNRAKESCRVCPVRAECLRYAIDNSRTELDTGQFGIWGGLDKNERTKLRNMLRENEVAA